MFYEDLVEYFINFNVCMCVFCVFYYINMFKMDGLGICIIFGWILLYILRLVFFYFNLVLVK